MKPKQSFIYSVCQNNNCVNGANYAVNNSSKRIALDDSFTCNAIGNLGCEPKSLVLYKNNLPTNIDFNEAKKYIIDNSTQSEDGFFITTDTNFVGGSAGGMCTLRKRILFTTIELKKFRCPGYYGFVGWIAP